MSPLVSVVIPLFNHEQYVAQTIESAIAQDYRPLEIIVVDDGSADRSYAVAKVFEHQSGEELSIRVHRQENRGVAAAFNFGIRQSRGALVAGIASDDYYLPGALRSSAELLRNSDSRTALVHAIVYLLDPKGRFSSTEGEYEPATGACLHGLLTREAGIWAPTMMFTRAAYDAVDGIDESLEAEDYDFFARLAARGYEFVFNPRHTVVKRVVPGSLGANTRRWYETPFRTLEKHRSFLTPSDYAHIRERLHLYVIRLAAGGSNYEAAHWALSRMRAETIDQRLTAEAYLVILKYRILNLVPYRVRAVLRGMRRHLRSSNLAVR
jgi:alpha-1,6-rhamnosyltransferase